MAFAILLVVESLGVEGIRRSRDTGENRQRDKG
jgi:hypothetical protein